MDTMGERDYCEHLVTTSSAVEDRYLSFIAITVP